MTKKPAFPSASPGLAGLSQPAPGLVRRQYLLSADYMLGPLHTKSVLSGSLQAKLPCPRCGVGVGRVSL